MKEFNKYLYHPFEIAICGVQNSGKTTLISKLLKSLTPKYDVAYFKHDAHKFEMDNKGKDTDLAYTNGAGQVMIFDEDHSAIIRKGDFNNFEKKDIAINYDFALVEGHKKSKLTKFVFVPSNILNDQDFIEYINSLEIPRESIFGVITQNDQFKSKEFDIYHRDDIESIEKGILEFLTPKIKLKGLILTGGQSKRMGKDKALIEYEKMPHAQKLFNLLSPFCEKTYISAKSNQWSGTSLENIPTLEDEFSSIGPMAGILTALRKDRDAYWIIVACDLPYLDQKTVENLVKNINPFKIATCYQSTSDNLPEPLCAVYSPRSFSQLMKFAGYGANCPRKILINSNIELLQQLATKSLDNFNHPEDLESYIKKEDINA